MPMSWELVLHLPVALRTQRYCFLSHSVLGEGVQVPGLVENSSKSLSWWEVPGYRGLSEEGAGCSLQVQVRAPLRPAPAGNANQDRMAQEEISLGTLGHW